MELRRYRFYFFSREESRPHVHVQHATGEAKFWLEPEISLAHNYGLTVQRLATAIRIAREHIMKSARRGTPISGAEVTNVSANGLWLLVDDRELFVAFEQFPWFADATIRQLTRLERPSPHHLYWPELDVDLAVESIERPEAYPLMSGARSTKRLQQPKARRASRKAAARKSRLRA
ncbi:MAG: DUF2442 domain-containing protein [Gemmatimonadaceae bacterium]